MSAREPTRRGYDVYEVVSAVQKAIRRSDVHGALYWASELERSGYGQWLWRRLSVIVHEDVAPDAGVTAEFWALKEMYGVARTAAAVKENPDAGSMEMMHAVVLLASAKKGRLVTWAVLQHYGDHMERREIPDEALDQHTQRGRSLKRGTSTSSRRRRSWSTRSLGRWKCWRRSPGSSGGGRRWRRRTTCLRTPGGWRPAGRRIN